ncbi:MAG: hypothetical protein JKZ03_00025 [Flavobacteriaceae bacterium]|nr:hypothetical protein [Flavobacteriaceae bacterium]
MSYGAYYAGWSNSAEVTIASGSYSSSPGGSIWINISTIGGNFDYSSGRDLSYNGYPGGSGSNFYGRVGLGGAPRVDIGGNSNVRYAGFNSNRTLASGFAEPTLSPIDVVGGAATLAKLGFAAGTVAVRNVDRIDLGSLLNASKFDKRLRGHGGALQYLNKGSAREEFIKLKKGLNVSEVDVTSTPVGEFFVKGGQKYTLRSKSKPSIDVSGLKEPVVIRFGEW